MYVAISKQAVRLQHETRQLF